MQNVFMSFAKLTAERSQESNFSNRVFKISGNEFVAFWTQAVCCRESWCEGGTLPPNVSDRKQTDCFTSHLHTLNIY